jgi:uncharacterized protein YfbU (UPF0304 family)
MLANQLRLLAIGTKDKDEKESLETRAEIFERGYVEDYDHAFGLVSDWGEFSEEQSQYVLDVLNMFTAIQRAKEDGVAFPEDPRMALSYAGFEDAGHSLYAKFLAEKMDKYAYLVDPKFNLPTSWKYRPMLSVWKSLANNMQLRDNDLVALAAAVEAIK